LRFVNSWDNIVGGKADEIERFRCQTLLIFYTPGVKRARHAAFGGITPLRGVGASFACAPGAARSALPLLNLSRDCHKFGSAGFSPLVLSRDCSKFRSALPQLALIYNTSETRTMLNFHHPGAKRARHAAFGGITPLRGVGASFACVPGAAGSALPLLNFSRDCDKFGSASFSPLNLSRDC
jgi:hypothetical protein